MSNLRCERLAAIAYANVKEPHMASRVAPVTSLRQNTVICMEMVYRCVYPQPFPIFDPPLFAVIRNRRYDKVMEEPSDRDALISEIRETIKQEMEREDVNTFALAKRLKNRVGQRTLYDFMEGKSDNINLGALVDILNALEIKLTLCFNRDNRYLVKAKWHGLEDGIKGRRASGVVFNKASLKMAMARYTAFKIIPLPPHPKRPLK